MDIAKKLDKAVECCSGSGYGITLRNNIREIVRDILREVVENGHELGGMGEYGRGWNDSKMQTKMIVKEMMERWKNES